MEDQSSSIKPPAWGCRAASSAAARPAKRVLIGLAAALLLLAFHAQPVRAAPLDDARAALGRGDSATAARIYRSLADQGNVIAMTQLGMMYRTGRGMPTDYRQALKWLDRAAALGSAEAQYRVGDMYLRGLGTEQDMLEAARYHSRAAEQGHARAQYVLGILYKHGAGVRKNYAKAAKWFARAAAQGMPEAQQEYGMLISSGRGASRDYVAAYKWLSLARSNGSSSRIRTQSAEALSRLERRMSPAQIAAARDQARAWRSVREGG